jgi:uncharacterized protein (TIGR03437 family)
VVNVGENSFSVYLGNGDGTFQTRRSYPAPLNPYKVAVGDFYGDGFADLIIASSSNGSLILYPGTGDGTFQPNMTLATGVSAVGAFLVEDLNGDGKPDLAVSGNGVVSILIGNGDGTFQKPLLYGTGTDVTSSQGLAICDFNGDGKADLAVTDVSGGIIVILGNGNGTFQAPAFTSETGAFAGGALVAVGDFNGDGKADLAFSFGAAHNVYATNRIAIRLGGLGQMTTTAIASSLNPSIYGQNVTLTAMLNPSTGQPPPSGTVTFFNGSTQLGTSPVVNGQAVFTTNLLPAGGDTLTASYGGDPIYFSSTSPPLIQSVEQENPRVALSSSANPSYFGQSILLTATILPVSGGPAPSGSVEFHDGSATLGTAAVDRGAATFITPALSVGAHAVTAIYSGDANYLGSTAPAFRQTVSSNAATVTALSVSAPQITLGQSVTLTAAVSSASGTPTGAVAFYADTKPLGTRTLAGGKAVVTTSLLASGKPTIHAYYSGNNVYTPSASPAFTETVSAQAANNFAPAPPIKPGSYGAATGDFNGDGKSDLVLTSADGLNVLLSQGDGTFQPAISYGKGIDFSLSGVLVGDLNGDGISDLVTSSASGVSVLLGNGDGTFRAPVTYAATGPPAFIADLNGDGNADIALSNCDVLPGNGDGTFQPPVRWLDNSYTGFVAVADFNNDGRPDLIATTATGTDVLVANGDGTYKKAESFPNPSQFPYHNDVTFAVGDFNGDGKPDLVEVLQGRSSGENAYWNVILFLGQGDGSFSAGRRLPTIYVYFQLLAVGDFNGDGFDDLAVEQFPDNAGVVIYPSSGNGGFGSPLFYSAPVTTPSYSFLLSGDFNGDGRNDIAAISPSEIDILLGQFLPTTTVTLTSSLNPSSYGQDVTFTATVDPPDVTGTVVFYDGQVTLGSAGVIRGQAVISSDALTVGTHILTAAFSGSGFYPATSAVLSQTVNISRSTLTLASSANPAAVGAGVLLTATISPSPTTGNIAFKDGTVTLGTGVLNNGTASLLVSNLAIGSHSLTASYVGGSNAQASVSNALIQTVVPGTAATITLITSANPSTYGQNVTLIALVSPTPAFGNVTFFDGTTVLGIKLLSQGRASLTTNLLAAGTRSLHAYYTGDAAHGPSSSHPITQVVAATPARGFQAPMHYTSSQAGGDGASLAVADFNGNGIPDFVATDSPNVNVFIGKADGTFQPPLTTYGGVFNSSYILVAAGDLNGDGKADLVITYGYTYGIGVLLGNRDGTFQPPVIYDFQYFPDTLAVADFNGDGRLDIVVGAADFNTFLGVMLGNGDGTFQPAANIARAVVPQALTVADFNGDGVPDLAVADTQANLWILLGNGDGKFSAQSYQSFHNVMSIAAADLNGDGHMDIVTASVDGNFHVHLGKGDGTFQSPVSYSYGYAQTYNQVGSAIGDFNGDGIPDLAITDPLGLAILLGRGDGTFRDPVYHEGVYNGVFVADFDGDGRTDVVLADVVLPDNRGRLGNARVSVQLGAADPLPSITPTGIVNAAGPTPYTLGLAPGSLAIAYGNFLLDSPSIATDLPLPDSLAGLSVQFGNGMSAPILAASNGKVTFQIPWEMAEQSQTTLSVTVNGRTSTAQPLALTPFAPAVFSTNGQGTGQAAVYDGSNRLVDASNPATPGSTVVQIYCTGLGVVQNNQPATGFPAPAQPLSATATIPQVSIGNVPAPVLFSGLVPGLVGVYQVNVLVPASLAAGGPSRATTVPVTMDLYSNAPEIAIK